MKLRDLWATAVHVSDLRDELAAVTNQLNSVTGVCGEWRKRAEASERMNVVLARRAEYAEAHAAERRDEVVALRRQLKGEGPSE